jgi:hypothetical protein
VQTSETVTLGGNASVAIGALSMEFDVSLNQRITVDSVVMPWAAIEMRV